MSTLTTALAAKEIEATEVETVKNGVTCTGYRLENGTNIRPVIYYSSGETVESFVERAFEATKRPTLNVNVENLISRDRLLSDTYLCVQKQGTEAICKRKYLNLELYVRLGVELENDDCKGSIKVTPEILDMAGLSEDELFEAAKRNSMEKATIVSMAEAIGMPEEIMGDVLFYVATYRDKAHGAGILAIPEVLHSYCESKGYSRINILPSSTEEILILPDEEADPETLAALVNDVNTSTVDEVLQLDPAVYLYDDGSRTVSIASSYIKEV